jgi:osmotically-inducible protein OsmY
MAVAVAFTVVGAAGCSSSPNRESTGEYLDDSTITTKVKAKFVEDKTISSTHIHVTTTRGTVELTGYASSQAEKDRAVELARQVGGVKDVKDSIEIRS